MSDPITGFEHLTPFVLRYTPIPDLNVHPPGCSDLEWHPAAIAWEFFHPLGIFLASSAYGWSWTQCCKWKFGKYASWLRAFMSFSLNSPTSMSARIETRWSRNSTPSHGLLAAMSASLCFWLWELGQAMEHLWASLSSPLGIITAVSLWWGLSGIRILSS